MDLESEKRIQEWLNGPYDQQTKETIRQLLRTNPQELQDAFFTTLSFGTGGLRGLMGVGSNRMNIYTVRISTQGLANYIKKQPKQRDHHGVVIGYDSRHHSREFAEETARVLAANQIQVYLLPDIRPTPFVSYCVRAKECTSGVMITASHNPKEYNGYKVYWSDGAQVVPPHDQGIIQEVKKIQKPEDVKLVPLNHPLIEILDLSLDNTYLSAIHHLMLNPKENKEHGDGLKIVYTPLHGTGIKLVPRALRDWGFTNVHLVGAQIVPDGNFPTVKSPNPEYPETLAMGIDQLKNSQSDILIATDPDADRMAVAILHHGNVEILNGNEIASICTEYICSTLEEQKKLPQKGAFVTTIVSTDLIRKIAESYGCLCFETLTGFKYIGEMIHKWEIDKNKNPTFLFGAEESYGFLLGTHARDKDAVIMSCFIAEIALLMKVEGKTLVDFLHDIYHKYGVYQETQFTINFPPGKEGIDKINAIMQQIRNHPPREIAGKQVTILEDYQMRARRELKTGKTEPLTLPTSNVLLFRLSDGSKLIFRPSGTEPKLKVYLGATKKEFKTIAEGIQACSETLTQLLNQAKELVEHK